jgi:uncharacterized protein YndB with AHSA1/START domain
MLLWLTLACSAMKERAITQAMDRIWNRGDLSTIDAAYTPELAAEVRRFVTENRALYPDIKVTIDRVVVKGPIFVTQWTVSGTHRDLKRPVTISGVSVRRWEGGKFVEETMVYDLKSVYDQLGFRVLPPAGASPFDTPAAAAGAAAPATPVIDTALFPVPSGRSVTKEVVVHAPRAEVWRAWTTSEGWRSFFEVDSRIELRVGGPYEIYFGPPEAGAGNRGCEGCQVLAWVPDQSVAFTWSAPPDFPEERAMRTFVVVNLADVPGGTRVTLSQQGFGEAGRWPDVQAYFEQAWGKVLDAQAAKWPAPPVEAKKNKK